MSLKFAFYGDDFTGATDTLATLAQAGLRTLLFLGIPSDELRHAAGPLDALGVAGAARSMDLPTMERELDGVGRFLTGLPAPVLHYKCCSTFDSAPTVGSLGAAARQLAAMVPNRFVPIVGGQPSLGRFCAFGNLFAAAGDGVVYRIDRHPTMSRHPVTPMNEGDLRRHLAAQGLGDIGLVDVRALDGGGDLGDWTAQQPERDPFFCLFDAMNGHHLQRIGRLIWHEGERAQLLAIGASSVAQAVIAHWRAGGQIAMPTGTPRIAAAEGPVFVLAGSQSPVTARQVAEAGSHFEVVAIDAAKLLADPTQIERAATACAQFLEQGRSVVAHTGRAQSDGPTPGDVAAVSGRLLRRVLERVPAIRRIGVAGGDTSSLAVSALDVWGLSFVGVFSPGASLVRAHAQDPRFDGIELMLKGGQMGTPTIFETLLLGMSAAH